MGPKTLYVAPHHEEVAAHQASGNLGVAVLGVKVLYHQEHVGKALAKKMHQRL